MFKKIFILFKIARKLAKSDALKIISRFHKPPKILEIFFYLMSFTVNKKKIDNLSHLSEEEKLCNSLQSMGTTFIKLGQFLSTRPDIVGEKLSQNLEKLQDKVPPFETTKANEILRTELGENNYKLLINLSEPVAAASIAQVHKAQIDDNGIIKDVAVKILRPEIKKVFNEEIDALMLFAYVIESLLKKTKRLKLVEVVFLL